MFDSMDNIFKRGHGPDKDDREDPIEKMGQPDETASDLPPGTDYAFGPEDELKKGELGEDIEESSE